MTNVIRQPRTGFWDVAASEAAPAVAQGISEGLGGLINMKMGQMMERQGVSKLADSMKATGYTPEAGYTPEHLQGLAYQRYHDSAFAKQYAPQIAQQSGVHRAYQAGSEYAPQAPPSIQGGGRAQPISFGGSIQQAPVQNALSQISQATQTPPQARQTQQAQNDLLQSALLQGSKNPGQAYLGGLGSRGGIGALHPALNQLQSGGFAPQGFGGGYAQPQGFGQPGVTQGAPQEAPPQVPRGPQSPRKQSYAERVAEGQRKLNMGTATLKETEQIGKINNAAQKAEDNKRAAGDRHQKVINEENKPITSYYNTNEQTFELGLKKAQQVLQLLESGKVTQNMSEYAFDRLPLASHTAETKQFLGLATELAEIGTQTDRGNPTDAKLQLKITTKPTVQEDLNTQITKTKGLIDRYSKGLLGVRLMKNAINENGGNQPKNLQGIMASQIGAIEEARIPFYKALERIPLTPQTEEGKSALLEKLGLSDLAQEAQQQAVAPQEAQAPQSQGPEVGNLLQQVGRPIARAAETVAGTPGNLLSGGLGIANYATGGFVPTYEDIQDKYLGAASFPTSSQIREGVTKKLTGEYLEPKNKGERFIDDLTELVTGIVTTGGVGAAAKAGTIKPFLTQAAKLGLGAQTAGFLTKEITGSDALAGTVKAGTLILAGMHGTRKNLEADMRTSYSEANKLAKGKLGNANSVKSAANTLTEVAESGLGASEATGSKKLIGEWAQALDKNIIKTKEGFKLDLKDAIELKKDIGAGLRDISKNTRAYVEGKNVYDSLNKFIKNTGSRVKGFNKTYGAAEEIYNGLNVLKHNAPKILSSVQDFAKKIHPKLGALLGEIGTPLGAASAGGYLGGYPGAIAGLSTAETVRVIAGSLQSPIVRKAYINAFTNIADKSVATLGRDLSKLNTAFKAISK